MNANNNKPTPSVIAPLTGALSGLLLWGLLPCDAAAQSMNIAPGVSGSTTAGSDSIKAHNEQGRLTLSPSGEVVGSTFGWIGDSMTFERVARASSGGDGGGEDHRVNDGIDRILDDLFRGDSVHDRVVLPPVRAAGEGVLDGRWRVVPGGVSLSDITEFSEYTGPWAGGNSVGVPSPGTVAALGAWLAWNSVRRRRSSAGG